MKSNHEKSRAFLRIFSRSKGGMMLIWLMSACFARLLQGIAVAFKGCFQHLYEKNFGILKF